MPSRILLTGAAGFVGHHILDYLLKETEAEVVCLVSFEHKGLSDRLRSVLVDYDREHPIEPRRVLIINHDLTAPIDSVTAARIGPVDTIMNVASESHVDRSITDPRPFILNNTALITTMLDYARTYAPDALFLQMSTDEVYGPARAEYAHAEWDPILPSNPYSASKAAQEAICYAYWRTYDLPIIITNTMNIFGPRQDPEKFASMVMRNVQQGKPVPIHARPIESTDGDKGWEYGSRFWLPAWDLADAWWYLSNRSDRIYDLRYSQGLSRPRRYNIVGQYEVNNRTMALNIAILMEKDVFCEPVDFHSSRPGHDLRYALDGHRMELAGWKPPMGYVKGLEWMTDWAKTPEAEPYL